MTSMTVKRRFSALNEGELVAEREGESSEERDSQSHTHTRKKLSKFLAFYLFAYACDNFIYVSARLGQKKVQKGR